MQHGQDKDVSETEYAPRPGASDRRLHLSRANTLSTRMMNTNTSNDAALPAPVLRRRTDKPSPAETHSHTVRDFDHGQRASGKFGGDTGTNS